MLSQVIGAWESSPGESHPEALALDDINLMARVQNQSVRYVRTILLPGVHIDRTLLAAPNPSSRSPQTCQNLG